MLITAPINWYEDFSGINGNIICNILTNSIIPAFAISTPSWFNCLLGKINNKLKDLSDLKLLTNLEHSGLITILSIVATYIVTISCYLMSRSVVTGTSIIGFSLLVYFSFIISYKLNINRKYNKKYGPRMKEYNYVFVIIFLYLFIAIVAYILSLIQIGAIKDVQLHIFGLAVFSVLVFILKIIISVRNKTKV